MSAIFPRILKSTSWFLILLLLVTSISCLCLTTILQRCVYPATWYQAPLQSRRPLLTTCLPSTCSRACVGVPPTSVGPRNQAHAFNPAGFSWYLLQALQYLRLRRVGHRDVAFCESFSVVGCGESHCFRSGLPDLCRGSLSAIFPRRLKCTS